MLSQYVHLPHSLFLGACVCVCIIKFGNVSVCGHISLIAQQYNHKTFNRLFQRSPSSPYFYNVDIIKSGEKSLGVDSVVGTGLDCKGRSGVCLIYNCLILDFKTRKYTSFWAGENEGLLEIISQANNLQDLRSNHNQMIF